MTKQNNVNKLKLSITVALLSLLLSGCLYPQTDSSSTTIVSKESMRNVQAAIDQYMNDKGILPIHNSDSSVDRYEKFRVNFDMLKKEGYVDVLPSSSFEGGGNYYFLILNEDTEPTVKAQSIYLIQKMVDVQQKVDTYKDKHGTLPAAEQLYDGFYALDYDALEIKAPELHSMYSGSITELLIADSGTVYINYASDIYQMMRQHPDAELSDDHDLRELLVMYSDYVPVKSAKYKLLNDEPVPYE